MLNLAYISEFVNSDLPTSLPETLLLNSTVSADFPELAISSPEYDAKLAIEDRAVYDLSTNLNLPKQDTMSFDSLSHFLCNKLLSSHTENESFDFFNVFHWLLVLATAAGFFALVLVAILHYRVRTMMVF